MRDAVRIGTPAGPRLPASAQSLIWFRRAQWMLDQCQARFGEMFTLKIANEGTWVVTSSPEVIKQVFTGDPSLLHAGEANRILLPVVGPNSVLLLDDDSHLRQRKLLLPAFHGPRMQRYGELMRSVAAEEIERWPTDAAHRLRPRMQALTLEVILHAVFGITAGPRLEQLRTELRRLLDQSTNSFNVAVLMVIGPERLGRLRRVRRELEGLNRPIFEEISERRASGDLSEREDIMSLLLQATHEDGSPMSDVEVRDELVTLLVAGHETTANSLSWAVERLSRHPQKLERLVDELEAGESGYLDAVVQETLRLRPVISIVLRRLMQPMEIGGYLLPAGVSIVPSIYLLHRRADLYPRPHEFEPERFLEQPPGTYTWIPFGGGVRRCLGAAFAQFEMQVVLRELVLRRNLTPSRARPERNRRRAITETPERGAEVLLARRSAAQDVPIGDGDGSVTDSPASSAALAETNPERAARPSEAVGA